MSLPIDTCRNTASSQPPQFEDVKEDSPSRTREFHPFSRLPPELRQQIWSLSIEPREFVFHLDYHLVSRSRNPALLDVCSESRDYALKFHYVKSRNGPYCPFRYQWVNFDVDTVRLAAHRDSVFLAAQYPIQKLIVECRGGDMATGSLYNILGMLLGITELREVALVGFKSCPPSPRYRNWWLGWLHLFEALYFPEADGDRARFGLRVVMPEHVEEGGPTELTLNNFLEK
ncbi:hypothetical protein PG985_000413 [Apiospora marii]|uniref:uncharacterized protein n=1 Tax=Apiospora marii TaxID=335849 RepID=UPI0031317D32